MLFARVPAGCDGAGGVASPATCVRCCTLSVLLLKLPTPIVINVERSPSRTSSRTSSSLRNYLCKCECRRQTAARELGTPFRNRVGWISGRPILTFLSAQLRLLETRLRDVLNQARSNCGGRPVFWNWTTYHVVSTTSPGSERNQWLGRDFIISNARFTTGHVLRLVACTVNLSLVQVRLARCRYDFHRSSVMVHAATASFVCNKYGAPVEPELFHRF